MEKPQSLAESLGIEPLPGTKTLPEPESEYLFAEVDPKDPKAFCQAIVSSKEFRRYILHGLTLGEIPAAIVNRLLDHAWGTVPSKHEHTGASGQPIVTEVRTVIVRSLNSGEDEVTEEQHQPTTKRAVH